MSYIFNEKYFVSISETLFYYFAVVFFTLLCRVLSLPGFIFFAHPLHSVSTTVCSWCFLTNVHQQQPNIALTVEKINMGYFVYHAGRIGTLRNNEGKENLHKFKWRLKGNHKKTVGWGPLHNEHGTDQELRLLHGPYSGSVDTFSFLSGIIHTRPTRWTNSTWLLAGCKELERVSRTTIIQAAQSL